MTTAAGPPAPSPRKPLTPIAPALSLPPLIMVLKKDEVLESAQLTEQLANGSGKYLYVNVVSKRCKQLASGSMRLTTMGDPCHALGDVVAKELNEDKLAIRPLPGNKLVNVLESLG